MKKELQQTLQKYKGSLETITTILHLKNGQQRRRNKFLDRNNFPRLNQEGIENMSRSIKSTES